MTLRVKKFLSKVKLLAWNPKIFSKVNKKKMFFFGNFIFHKFNKFHKLPVEYFYRVFQLI